MTTAPVALLADVERGRADRVLDMVRREVDAGASVTSLVTDVLAPAQQLVGERWQRGEYTISQEHAASATIEDALGLLAAHTRRVRPRGRIAMVCATGEWHTTPARMAALGLRDAGWKVDFLGGSTPPDHVAEAIEHTRPQALAVSATLPLALAGVVGLVEVAHAVDLPVLVGGRAFGADDRRAATLGADAHATDVTTASAVLSAWLDTPPVRSAPSSAGDAGIELASLQVRRIELVDDTWHALAPTWSEGDHAWPVDRVPNDLDELLAVLGVTLLVDDPDVLLDHVGWLEAVLRGRGAPAGLVARSLEAVLDRVGADLPRCRDLLRLGLGRCHGRGAD